MNNFAPTGDPANMSYKQQIQYLLERNKEASQETDRFLEEELRSHIEQEKVRGRLPPMVKQRARSKLVDEANQEFTLVHKNQYLDRKPTKLRAIDVIICKCPSPELITDGPFAGHFSVKCGWRCLNRVINTECHSSFCKNECTNQRFQQQKNVQTYPGKTKNRGWGLMAGQLIQKGTFIMQYIGEVYSLDGRVGQQRLEKYRKWLNNYLMSSAHNEVIDASVTGGFARFMNHSCDPNCETQRWTVQGEICVGLFAKKEILEDEELTFDYRFDMYNPVIRKCLCGSSNCKGFLGENLTQPESKAKNKCKLCKRSGENLQFCQNCQKPYHSYCVPLKDGRCPKCTVAPSVANFREIIQLAPRHKFEIIQIYLEQINVEGVQLTWKSSVQDQIEMKIRGPSDKVSQVMSIISTITQEELIQLSFEAIYLKSILEGNPQNFEKNNHVRVNYDSEDFTDEVFPMSRITSLEIQGPRASLQLAANKIFARLETITACTIYVTIKEYAILQENINQFRALLLPTEIRVSRDNFIYESAHPYLKFSKSQRRIVLIGTDLEIQQSYRLLQAKFHEHLKGELEVSLTFVLPGSTYQSLKKTRDQISQEASEQHSTIIPVIKLYEPVPPKQYLTVYLIGTWSQILAIKERIIRFCEARVGKEIMASFFPSVVAKMYRHSLKSTCKYIHILEKRKEDMRKRYSLKCWDIYTYDVLGTEPQSAQSEEFRNDVMKHLLTESDPLVCLIRLCTSESEVKRIIHTCFELSLERAFSICINFFNSFGLKFVPREDATYKDEGLLKVAQGLIDMNENQELFETDLQEAVCQVTKRLRNKSENHPFHLMPISYGTSYSPFPSEIEHRLKDFFGNLESAQILRPSELDLHQDISLCPPLEQVRNHANLIVGCYRQPRNLLYVVWAHKAQNLSSFS